MPRTLVLGAFPRPATTDGYLTITPNFQAARSLGVAKCTLAHLAERSGVSPATEMLARHALRQAVAAVLQPRDRAGTARTWAPALRELLRTGADLTMIPASPRLAQLAALALTYRQLLADLGRVDEAELLWAALRRGMSPTKLLVAGYARLGPDGTAFIDGAAGEGSVLYLPWGEEPIFAENQRTVRYLAERGWQVAEEHGFGGSGAELARKLAGKAIPLPGGVSAIRYCTLEAEVRAVLAAIKQGLGQGVRPTEIALVCGDVALYAPTLLAVAWEYGLPLSVRDEVPLALTGLGAQIERALDAGDWPDADERQGWLVHLAAVARVRPNEEEARRALFAALAELPADAHLTRQDFCEEVREALALVRVPRAPRAGCVEVHAPLAMLGTCYAHLFVLGLAEGMLPRAIADDPVLDFYERSQAAGLGLATAVDLARREQLLLAGALAAGTGQLSLSYPELVGRDPREPGACFERLGLVPVAASETAALSPEEIRQRQLTSDPADPAYRAWQIECRRLAPTGDPDPYGGAIGTCLDPDAWVFSPSQLVEIGQCPFRWFVRRLLGLAPPAPPPEAWNPALRGRFVHRVLERLLAPLVGRPAAEALPLEAAFAQVEAEMTMQRIPEWSVRRGELLLLLRDALAQPDFLPPETVVAGVEVRFDGLWRGLVVTGRIDRIERTGTQLVVLDYKSGGAQKVQDGEGRLSLDIQLAIYREMVTAAGLASAPAEKACYFSLGRSEQRRQGVRESDPAALDQFAARVRAALAGGHFPVQPDRRREACNQCDYQLLCRRPEPGL